MSENSLTKSKYIKNSKEPKVFRRISIFFLISWYILPIYFGIELPGFDLTAIRLAIILLLIMIIASTSRLNDFIKMCKELTLSMVFLPYIFVIGYTMVFRVDFNAFFNPFMDILAMFLLIYAMKESLGAKETIKFIRVFIYILVLLGIVEFLMDDTPFKYLETISGIKTARFVRSGHYRIMSNCVHSLGYGLMLLTAVPFAVYDERKDEADLFRRPFLLVLILLNVFLTGSRSTLGVVFLELALVFIFSKKYYKKRALITGFVMIIAFIAFLIVAYKTSLGQYILLQITTVIDEILGTNIAEAFGASQTALEQSSDYRDKLIKIFQVSWLNPLIGIGRKRSFSGVIDGSTIKSIDSFYIAEYVRYAYPGMIAFIMVLLYFLWSTFKNCIQTKSGLSKVIFISILCYMINIYWVDSLQTFKYIYALMAIFIVANYKECINVREKYETNSRYLKKANIKKWKKD